MNVLQINKLYYPTIGGIETSVQQLSEGARRRGVDVKVLVCRPKGNAEFATINGVPVTYAASFGIYNSMPVSIDFMKQFRLAIKEADILHIHMPFPLADLATLLFGKKYTGKIVVSWHCDIVKQKKALLFYKPLMKWLLDRCDLITAESQNVIDNSRFLTSFKNKAVVIPPMVDPYFISASDNTSLCNRTGDTVNILFVGRLVYYKGCHVLIEAFSKTRGAHLTIVGNGPLKGALETQIASLGISDKVTFKQDLNKESLAVEYSNCDFLVLPSIETSEAFGLVQIEAMAFGKPVINTYLPTAVPAVSVDKFTGLTVFPRDVNALAEAMQTLVDNKQLRLSFGRNAYQRVRTMYTEDIVLKKTIEQYNNLLVSRRADR